MQEEYEEEYERVKEDALDDFEGHMHDILNGLKDKFQYMKEVDLAMYLNDVATDEDLDNDSNDIKDVKERFWECVDKFVYLAKEEAKNKLIDELFNESYRRCPNKYLQNLEEEKN